MTWKRRLVITPVNLVTAPLLVLIIMTVVVDDWNTLDS
eukprot:CAMPEP_0172462884 /NCGR_PEP_ID=MMETSP1065-20121228/45361_1 /TAXON_ID=265537 /ORGANISM="Amphiprora paludosa, Strain CCMP125" /LENGTH=37 /DNA_ID= /DNA_START= /DNA_END= /DNA_ORIENTATION=